MTVRALRIPSRHRRARAAIAALAAVLAATTGILHLSSQAEIAAIRTLAGAVGFADTAALIQDLTYQSDPDRARLALARAIVGGALDPATAAALGDRLETARTLAAEALPRRPSDWQAPMILGAATYLQQSVARDPALIREARRWQDPLLRSRELAPAETEPTQFLATAYLELWPVLSEERQESAREIVRLALADMRHFDRLLPPWLARAESTRQLFAAMPEAVYAWGKLRRAYADEHDWRGFVAAHERLRQAQAREDEKSMAEAEERLAGGDLRYARHMFLLAASSALPELENVPLVARALELCPPAPFNAAYAEGLRRHLELALELCQLRDCPYEPAIVARMAANAGELPPPLAARAALAGGDLGRAELIERQNGALPWSPEWSAYRLDVARELTRRKDLEAAEAALDLLHPTWLVQPEVERARLELARAGNEAAWIAAAERRLAELARRELGPRDWERRDRVFRARFWSEAPVREARLTFADTPAEGAAIAVRSNGRHLDTVAIRQQREITIPLAGNAREIHLLEIETLGGAVVVPGRLELR